MKATCKENNSIDIEKFHNVELKVKYGQTYSVIEDSYLELKIKGTKAHVENIMKSILEIIRKEH